VKAFPDAARPFRDDGLCGVLGVHVKIVVGAVPEELGAAGPEVGDSGDELLGRRRLG
jgi:hypothetical protein